MINDSLVTDRRIKKSIISLQKTQPFFGYIALNIKLQEIDKNLCPTMGVDSNFNLYYNKEWLDKNMASYQMMEGCICHEVLHIALNHVGLLGQRMKNISNIAQDMVVNNIVKRNNMILLEGKEYVTVEIGSDIGIVNFEGSKVGKITITNVSEKSWERIYEEILLQIEKSGEDPQKFENDMNGDSHSFDKVFRDAFNKLSKSEQAVIQEKIKQVLAEALINSKMIGQVPGGMERYIKDLLEPKIPWQNQFNKYIKNHIEPNDFWYRKPHRKSYSFDIYIPGVKKENIEIEVMVDSSGSIDNESFKEFFTEVYGIMKSNQNVKVYLSVCDIQITDELVLNKTDLPKLLAFKPKGGGGTDLFNGLNQIVKKKRKSDVCVVLTDGETQFKNIKYPFEVIWVINKKGMELDQAKKHFKGYNVIKMR